MRYDIERIANILNATVEQLVDARMSQPDHRLFADARLKYVLHLMADTSCVFLAADPEDPEQAGPMFEYGFTCTDIEIGPSAYGEDELAIRFFEHRDTRGGLRQTFTPRHDKNWYMWANVGGDHAGDGMYRIR